MESESAFGRVTLTPEAIMARVRNEVTRDCEAGRFDPCPPPEAVDQVVSVAVNGLWNSRVKTFVSLLALREARERLARDVDAIQA
jgi:hypothetical protein